MYPVNQMGHLVRSVVRDWERGAHGSWSFHPNITWPKHDVVVRENEIYSALLGMVRAKYKLDQHLHPTDPVVLTYEFPHTVTESGENTSPPIEITSDEDVEVFMYVRIDHVFLELYVSFEGHGVDRYRMQRELVDIEGEDDENGAGPETQPWGGG